jgi:hypothetical protein
VYTVGGQKQGRLNWLQHNLPEGLLADAAWLERHGYSRGLRAKYVANGWLDRLGHGVFRRPQAKAPGSRKAEELRWESVVVSLQTLIERPFVVGGRTALELQGFAHYLAAEGPREVHLYGEGRPPGWATKLPLDSRLTFHREGRLFTDGSKSSGGVRCAGQLLLSSPERAILELLDEVPPRETFHQADVLMEGLRNLSPHRLRKLLLACRSVKVKRLFFWFAERHNHAWLNRLDRTGIDLGSGKRMLARGGKLDTKYKITVPESLDGDL